MLRIVLLKPSAIAPPLHRMEIRFDGLQNVGGLRTVNGARFGMTRNGGARAHNGVDLYAPLGTPVLAIADGQVERVRLTDPSYGKDILLKFRPRDDWLRYLRAASVSDDDGLLFAEYAHLSNILVSQGTLVRRGQIIGFTGTSGNADQRYPHLHFEVRKVSNPGTGAQGLLNRINPEILFPNIDFSKPVETLARAARTA